MEEATGLIDYKTLYEQAQSQIIQVRHKLDQLKKMIFESLQEQFLAGQPADPLPAIDRPVSRACCHYLLRPGTKIEYKRTTSILASPVTIHLGRIKSPNYLQSKDILVDVEEKEGCRQNGQEVPELEYEPGRL